MKPIMSIRRHLLVVRIIVANSLVTHLLVHEKFKLLTNLNPDL